MEATRKYLRISSVQIKLSLFINLILSLVILAITPVIFGIKNLDSIASSYVLERFVALIGIILITPIFLPEQDKNIAELIESKYTSPIKTYLLRFFISSVTLFILISGFILIMVTMSCEFNILKFIIGTFATAFFLGTLGAIVYGISDNIVAGYLIPLSFYMWNMFSKSDEVKNLYLFSLVNDSFSEKYWLLGLGFLFIIVVILYKWIVIKTR